MKEVPAGAEVGGLEDQCREKFLANSERLAQMRKKQLDPDAGKKQPVQVGRYAVRPCKCTDPSCDAWNIDPPAGRKGFTREEAIRCATVLDEEFS